jgi:hypothetical protein
VLAVGILSYILEGHGMENVAIFSGHLLILWSFGNFVVIWLILWSFG